MVRVPGIGKKTAERLLVELKDKVDSIEGGLPVAGGLLDDTASIKQQAVEALEALGYKNAEAKRLLDKSAEEGQSVEEMIRAALRSLSR